MSARELTRNEKKKIRSLVTGMCANYDEETGLCLPLDTSCYMLTKCWTGAYCRYFEKAVLPLNPALEAALATESISPELPYLCRLWEGLLPGGTADRTVPPAVRRRETGKRAGNVVRKNAGEKSKGGLLRI